MSRKGKFDYKEFQEFANKIQKLAENEASVFAEACAKEIAKRLLAELQARTPVGDYSGGEYTCKVRKGGDNRIHFSAKVTGKVGGTLRRSWTIKNISKNGNTFSIEIMNPTEYASYVNSGHRTKNGGWVEGHFMIENSVDEIEQTVPKKLEQKLNKMFLEVFK